MTAAQLQRYTTFFSGYNYIMVQNTKQHSTVDGLSQKQTTNKRDGHYQHVSHFTTAAANHYIQ